MMRGFLSWKSIFVLGYIISGTHGLEYTFSASPGPTLDKNFQGTLTLHCSVPASSVKYASQISLSIDKMDSINLLRHRFVTVSTSFKDVHGFSTDGSYAFSGHVANSSELAPSHAEMPWFSVSRQDHTPDPLGHVTNASELAPSHVEMTWFSPTSGVSGQYVCMVNTLDQNFQKYTHTKLLNITVLRQPTTTPPPTTTTTPPPTTTTTPRPTTTTTPPPTTTTTQPQFRVYNSSCAMVPIDMIQSFVGQFCERVATYKHYCQKSCSVCSGSTCVDVHPGCVDLAMTMVCQRVRPLCPPTTRCPFLFIDVPDVALIHEMIGATATIDLGDVGGCFPSFSTVLLSSRKRKSMKDLVIGDKPLCVNKNGDLVFSEIYMFLHHQTQILSPYYVLQTKNGKEIRLTHDHLLYVLEESSIGPVPPFTSVKLAEDVQIGDIVSTVVPVCMSNSEQCGMEEMTNTTCDVVASRVINKTRVFLHGLHAPVTAEGTIIVDDVLASCFGMSDDVEAAQVLFSPFWLLYKLRHLLPAWVSELNTTKDVHWFAALLWQLAPVIDSLRETFHILTSSYWVPSGLGVASILVITSWFHGFGTIHAKSK